MTGWGVAVVAIVCATIFGIVSVVCYMAVKLSTNNKNNR